ncbi:MAG: GGDEF domain-containing protein, partial [Pseudomonas sp.]
SGSMQLNNSQNIAMLAGYASVPRAGWGVVTQRSLNATLSGMNQQMLSVARYSFPFFLLIMFVVWVMSKWISRPLWQLARSAESLDKPNMNAQIASIHAWYFEASQLRRALLRGLAGLNKMMGKLSMENITDPLTGLINRRGMQAALNEWEEERQPFSVIMGDIDYFKQVNDTFGHAIGDQVLQFVAKHMLESSREGDLVCRVGGEEFMLLLPNTDLSLAKNAAERLRLRIANDVCSSIGQAVTLSFGVSSWIPGQASITEVMNNADHALYSAKKAGRNRVHDSATIAS